MKSLLDIPGYAEAVDNERVIRDASFLPINERIGPFEVRPMSLRHFIILRTSGNPLLRGGKPLPHELAAFLWVLNPGFTTCLKSRDRFLKRCRRHFSPTGSRLFRRLDAIRMSRATEIVNRCKAFVDESLQDFPKSTTSNGFDKEYYSDATIICAEFAREFGWDDESTLDKPLKRIFQYRKEMKQEANPNAILFNQSDRVLIRGAQ